MMPVQADGGSGKPRACTVRQLGRPRNETHDLRNGFHKKLGKVPGAKHEIRFERSQVVEEDEFIEKYLQQPVAGDGVSIVDGLLQSSKVTVFKRFHIAMSELRLIFPRVTHPFQRWPTWLVFRSSRCLDSCSE